MAYSQTQSHAYLTDKTDPVRVGGHLENMQFRPKIRSFSAFGVSIPKYSYSNKFKNIFLGHSMTFLNLFLCNILTKRAVNAPFVCVRVYVCMCVCVC